MEYYKKCGYNIQDGKAIIPEGETEIKDRAFRDCKEITSISFPSSVKKIEGFAFSCCSNLTSIFIPESVTEIEDGAFSCCI